MKEEYFEKLTQLFLDNNFDEKTYTQIIEKYRAWYDKLIEEGKSDEEIQVLLKSPKEVVEVFTNKFKQQVQEEVKEEVQTVEETYEETIESDIATNSDIPETTSSSQAVDPYLITKTNRSGKTLYYRKRSFGGSLGMFFLFFLASILVIAVLGTLFTTFLSLSYFSLLVFFVPLMYLGFIFNFESVAYLQPSDSSLLHNTADRVLTLPYEFINNIIAQLNEMTSFDWTVFLQTIFISLFAFALLLLSLYFTLQTFKAFVSYFSYFFNKIALKRVKI